MSESSATAEPHDDNPILHFAHEAHGALAGFESLEGLAHLFGGHHAAAGGVPAPMVPVPSALGLGLGMLGLPLGGFSMARGIDEVSKGDGSQGTLDIASGALGMTSGVSSIMAVSAAPEIAAAAGLAGLAAYGNKDAQAAGWYGNDRDGDKNTFLGSIRDKTADGQSMGLDVGHTLLGNSFVGDVAGGVLGNSLGALGGVNQTFMNTNAAIGTGAVKLAGDQVDFVREHPILGSALAPGWGAGVAALDTLMR
ncbi:MAG: hypothetical protein K8W52_26950 [Deltaproteobacteria bacterium]|nr:hypothetical protein [Deltaproteobacteria bacterium]